MLSNYVSECVQGRYGSLCDKPCGACANGALCTPTGGCPSNLCAPGFKPPDCRGSSLFSCLLS